MELKLNRRFQHVASKLLPGTPIWDFDWDVCCILDGCRVDSLRNTYPDARSYWSVASSSPGWVDQTFSDRDLSSVGYVTANPFSERADPDRFGFFRQEIVDQTEYGIETVTPERLATVAGRVWGNRESHGINKLIVHFMQPHVPFRAEPGWFTRFTDSQTWGSTRWDDVGRSVDRSDWFDAYVDNLQWALAKGVQPLAECVDGTIGVTADHGNAAGGWGIYGHPRGVVVPSVRKVPWVTINAKQTQHTGIDNPLSESQFDTVERDAQLEALGYK